MRRLLLISSSRTHGTGFLEHCAPAIAEHLAGIRQILFIPFALADYEGYTAIAEQAFDKLAVKLASVHRSKAPGRILADAEAVFVGGGNTFRLLKKLYLLDLLGVLRDRVTRGALYIGSSAGTNLACPTIKTTNDMPIVQPPSFDALDLIPFQINPHFLDPDPNSRHQGETRSTRLTEYLEENHIPVLGIREGSWLTIQGDSCQMCGASGGVLFQRDNAPAAVAAGTPLDWLMRCAWAARSATQS